MLLSLWQWNNCNKLNGYNKWQHGMKSAKNGHSFFSLVGLKRSAYTWSWCIYVIWSCVRFLSFCFYHIDLCVETETYHRCNAEKLSLYYLWPLSVHHTQTHTHTHTQTHVWLHFIAFSYHVNMYECKKLRSGLQQMKLAKKYHCSRKHTTRLHEKFVVVIAIYHRNAMHWAKYSQRNKLIG